jgi:hypothetical protein
MKKRRKMKTPHVSLPLDFFLSTDLQLGLEGIS